MPRRTPENPTGSPSAFEPVDAFVTALRDTARRQSLIVTEDPTELRQSVTRSQEFAGQLGLPSNVPQERSSVGLKSLFVDNYAVLIGALGAVPDQQAVSGRLGQYHRHAAISLTWLPPRYRSDLNLFLVGPPGAGGSTDWATIASRVERDESVCRKMVWLPPEEADQAIPSASHFLARTFLARPWSLSVGRNSPSLSPLAKVSSTDAMLQRWLVALDAPDDPGASLIDRLIEAWREGHNGGNDVPQSG